MKWLEETHGTGFELVRHFLERMFDSELFTARGQGRTVAVSLFALALPAGLMLLDPPYLLHPIPRSAEALRAVAIADELALLTLFFCVTGLLALLVWQSLFPSRRDYLALAGLPVRPRQVFTARFASVLLFAAAVVGVINILPAFMAPHHFTSHPEESGVMARFVPACLGCFFMFFAIVTLQGALLNVLPVRLFARVSSWVQGALIAVLFLAGLCSWYIVDGQEALVSKLPGFGVWAPPVWFAGLNRVMTGDHDPFFAAMARRALLAAVAAPVAAVLAYLLSYRRYARLLLEAPDDAAAPRVRQWGLMRLLAGDPRQEAALGFMTTLLARSRLHRMVLLAYAGAAVAIVLNSSLLAGAPTRWAGGWQPSLQFAVLFWPLCASMILLAGIRHVFSIPVELRANWMFQLTESQGRAAWMAVVERLAIACAIVPVPLVLLPVAAGVLGWPVTLRMTALQLLVSLTAFELLFYSWQQLPFTCSYVPGKRPLTSLLLGWIGVLGVLVPVLAVMIAMASRMTGLFVIFGAIFASVWIWARVRRRQGWGEAKLIYEDLFEAVPDLGIRDVSYGGVVPEAPEVRETPQPAADGSPPGRDLPSPLAAAWLRLKAAARRPKLDDDLDSELAFHVAMREQKYQSEGLAPADARAAARRQFGNIISTKEQLRDMWTFAWIETLWHDLKYGARQLRRSPAFTCVAAVTLALGIGATTAIFSMFDAVLWRPIPLPHLERLAMVLQALPGNSRFWSAAAPADLEDIRGASTSIESLASWTLSLANLVEAGGEAVRVEQSRVTANFFDVLGVRPALGRTFRAGEDQPGQEFEVVLSDGCWRRRFAADPEIVGKRIRLDDQDYTVIGVMPTQFGFPRTWKELWTPLVLTPQERHSRTAQMLESIGRLKPGRSREQVAAELNGIAARLAKLYPESNRDRRFVAWPVARYWSGDAPVYAAMLLGATLFVLLIACANVASLQFARAAGRAREVAVRTALGAGRRRLVIQLVTESLLLAAGAAALGLLAAKWGLWLIRYGVPLEMRHYMAGWDQIGLNARAFVFALAAAAATALPFSRHWNWGSLSIEGRPPEPGDRAGVLVQTVSPEYFETMLIPLRAGLRLSDRDGLHAVPVAVISQRTAEHWWPGEAAPLGRRIRVTPQGPWVTIAGVVGDVRSSVFDHEPPPAVYLADAQFPQRAMDIAIRSAGDPLALAQTVRAAIRALDPEQPITNLNPLGELIRQESFGFAYMAVLMGIFGAIALALSSAGAYGLMAYVVSEQTHEIGVRMALGATRGNVLGGVFRRGMVPATVGLLIGLVPAYGVSRLVRAMVFGVASTGPSEFFAIPLVLIAAAALAIYVPARRATHVDPIAALRNE